MSGVGCEMFSDAPKFSFVSVCRLDFFGHLMGAGKKLLIDGQQTAGLPPPPPEGVGWDPS